MDLKNKVILVTGAAQGLGQAMSIALARKGAQLALLDLDIDRLSETQILCTSQGSRTESFAINVADENSVISSFQAIFQSFGAIHGLINNAGILRDALLIKAKEGKVLDRLSLADWEAVIQVNLRGVFLCTREAATHMIQNSNPGVIVNISSISRAGNMGQTNYTAAKAGVAGMTVTWAKELARYGIRVGAIAPGFIETPMTRGMKVDALEKMVSGIPLRRMGQADEIAHSAIYIFENDYFTGRIIECDGGLRL